MRLAKLRYLLSFVLFYFSSFGQEIADKTTSDTIQHQKQLKFNYKQLIIPTVLIGYGVVGLESHQLLSFNSGIKEEVKEHIDEKFTIDDFSQYTPMASVYMLNVFGIKGKNNFRDRTIILITSYLIMGLVVNGLKKTASVERPDGTSFNSFPSGHTATAFMGAEFLYQEYKDVSIWYGISGYFVAAGTGTFRMYNNRHWVTDVVAGAGIGILSTKAAYWLYPTINKLFKSKNNKNRKIGFIPYYDGEQTGFSFVSSF